MDVSNLILELTGFSLSVAFWLCIEIDTDLCTTYNGFNQLNCHIICFYGAAHWNTNASTSLILFLSSRSIVIEIDVAAP